VHAQSPEHFKDLLQWLKNTYQRHRLCTVLLDVFVDHITNCSKDQSGTERKCHETVEKPCVVWSVGERTSGKCSFRKIRKTAWD